MPADPKELERYFAWRDAMRRKPRTMTMGEYRAWLQGGDLISHPSRSSNFLGGLTILLDTPPIIGKVDGYEPPPALTDFSDMVEFFEKEHGLPFKGNLIEWR